MSSIPTGGNFIFEKHLDANFVQKCQKCVRSLLFTKTSINSLHMHKNSIEALNYFIQICLI